ncbi:hypothetical protein JCM19232_2661 [Vibrio ishigakensis]|uniref:Uncharacterized protein n=1 Tax=Vibrio ishigakensis TaxID=1481914 RepID=A0A0B8PBC3_9VIBR|nr:hypothetical protein JCM19232_2661 [Vibrio ishigakensis]
MLLEVLGKPAGFDSTDCKERLHPMLSGPETSKESYADRFPKGVLDSAQKKQIVRLRQLLSNE